LFVYLTDRCGEAAKTLKELVLSALKKIVEYGPVILCQLASYNTHTM